MTSPRPPLPIGPVVLFPKALQNVLNALPDVTIIAVLVIALLFTVLYRNFFNYRLTRAGRAVATLILAATEVLALGVFATLFGPDYPFRWLIREAVFLHIGWGMLSLLIALWHSWHDTPAAPVTLGQAKPRKKEGPYL